MQMVASICTRMKGGNLTFFLIYCFCSTILHLAISNL